eukprot:2719158-Prymnesium_polylepis.1
MEPWREELIVWQARLAEATGKSKQLWMIAAALRKARGGKAMSVAKAIARTDVDGQRPSPASRTSITELAKTILKMQPDLEPAPPAAATSPTTAVGGSAPF